MLDTLTGKRQKKETMRSLMITMLQRSSKRNAMKEIMALLLIMCVCLLATPFIVLNILIKSLMQMVEYLIILSLGSLSLRFEKEPKSGKTWQWYIVSVLIWSSLLTQFWIILQIVRGEL